MRVEIALIRLDVGVKDFGQFGVVTLLDQCALGVFFNRSQSRVKPVMGFVLLI